MPQKNTNRQLRVKANMLQILWDGPYSFTPGLGQPLSAGNNGQPVVVAIFTDPAGPEVLGDYSASIDWGDNTKPTAGAITFDPTTDFFNVTGDHTYNQSGDYDIIVSIHHDIAPNAMAFDTAHVPEGPPTTIPTLFNTGVDDNHNLLAAGAPDPHYQIIAAPSPDVAGAADVVIDNGFPFNGYWVHNDAISQWIAPHANENDTNGGVSEPVGNYTYQTTFDLTGFDPNTASISGQYTDDNTLVEVMLNGKDVGISSSSQTDFYTLHSFTISSGFVAGVNTLDFVVYNMPQTAHPNNGENPSGFRVEMTGTADPTEVMNATIAAPTDPQTLTGGLTSPTSVNLSAKRPSGDPQPPHYPHLSALDLPPEFFQELARHHNHALNSVDAYFASVGAGEEVV
jgi:hypothetical protein